MRIRSIKPEFWRSPDTAHLDMFTRLLFIGLWNYVDDNGVGDDDVDLIRSDLFPRDTNVEELSLRIHGGLTELSVRAQVTRYRHRETGRRYLHVTNWHHQKINRPSRSNKPLPTSENVEFTEGSLSTHGGLTEGSLQDLGNKGAREQGNEGPRERGGAGESGRGSRLPANWQPAPEVVAQMRSDHSHIDCDRELEKFRDYWRAVPGAKGRKTDWDATFRNWIRRAAESTGHGRSGALGTVDQKVTDWLNLDVPYDDEPPHIESSAEEIGELS